MCDYLSFDLVCVFQRGVSFGVWWYKLPVVFWMGGIWCWVGSGYEQPLSGVCGDQSGLELPTVFGSSGRVLPTILLYTTIMFWADFDGRDESSAQGPIFQTDKKSCVNDTTI